MTSGADPGALHLTVRLEVLPPDLSSSVPNSAFRCQTARGYKRSTAWSTNRRRLG
jgi:hypothetical protein